MLRDINKNTVDFGPNYDGEETEPKVMPARFPNLFSEWFGRYCGRYGYEYTAT